ncbi:aminoglycoside 3'-phosphotransferase/choline kinase family protein [Bradyrhizobium sp. WSM 1704]|uniref:aminoglycoside phosphotransferase family protein n=1 Tax=Bradyrhizobium semiaridum TaxID=2821404 RepID=UPI001CE37FBA|nr:aminoglycoside 3'-phosphotransferase/choline kinase family protein [Bradyrhizobium semiaridum]MCA6124762.1 aminoglycoside 3'-phosphotransferase/choline kinase family protein [Bradyrhizobium semiaridum]
MIILPPISDYDTYRSWRGDPARWLPVVREIADRHSLACTAPHVFATGTNLVVGLDGELILKIFPPLLRPQFVSERMTLGQLRERLAIPIPEIVAEGERDGWPYLVITRLEGVVGSEVWPSLAEAERERVLGEIGAVIAAVQRVPVGPLLAIEPRWDVFMRGQIAQCRTRHVRLGLPAKFLAGLDDLLRAAAELIPMDAPPVILTGEYIPENFLLARRTDGWHVTGLFDFGDMQTGWGEYDLLGPSAFMAAGHPRRVRSLLDGFGIAREDVTFGLKRRLMALLLLHRHSDPLRHICISDWPDKASDLVQLQELIWPD